MSKKFVVGVDIGGTYIKAGILDKSGKIWASSKIETQLALGTKFVSHSVAEQVTELLERAKIDAKDVRGVGIGVPGLVDSKNGIVGFAGNLNWIQVPIGQMIGEALNLPTKVANDANVAALGESKFGASKAFSNSVLVTLGTGVGSGIVIDNKLYEGNLSAGAEIGHIVVVKGGEKCSCGRNGCFEAYASANALVCQAKEILHKKTSKFFGNGFDLNELTAKQLFDVWGQDGVVDSILENYLGFVAEGLIDIANVLRPEAILIGGGISEVGERLVVDLRERVKNGIFAKTIGPEVQVLLASLGNNAGFVGAGALFL